MVRGLDVNGIGVGTAPRGLGCLILNFKAYQNMGKIQNQSHDKLAGISKAQTFKDPQKILIGRKEILYYRIQVT